MLRSATSATRLTASTNGAVSTTATVLASRGHRDWYCGNSLSSRRCVVRRPLPSNPIRPSPPGVVASAIVTLSAADSARAVSARLRAGTSATAEDPLCSGDQCSSRTASR